MAAPDTPPSPDAPTQPRELHGTRHHEPEPSLGATLPSPPSPARAAPFVGTPGARLGRYIVLDRAGAGGMGSVLAAYDPELDRKVALKLVRLDLAGSAEGDALQQRLRAEARTMAKLSHPNVVTVFDVGLESGLLYIAMEWVDGETLRELQNRRPPPRQLLERYLDAGRGLAAAHRAGIVHRDFKAENVLVDKAGRARVSDFGIAQQRLSEDARPTPLEGTPGYIAPELGSATARPDARGDQFSFCVALYEALYGERPFEGRNWVEQLTAASRGQVKEPAPGPAPRYLWPLLKRGLSARPEDRFPDLEVLLKKLERDPARRRRRLALRASAFAAVLLLGAGGVVRNLRESVRCADQARAQVAFWGPPQRQAVRDAFLATRVPGADQTVELVTRALDAQTAQWVQEETGRCDEVRSQGESATTLRHRPWLERRRAMLQAAVEAFASANADLVSHAPRAVEQLAVLAREGAPLSLPVAHAPSDPGVGADLARAEFFLAARQAGQAAELASSAARRATLEADELGLAQAQLLLGLALVQRGDDMRAAESTLRAAVRAAEATGSDEWVARGRLGLVFCLGVAQDRHAEALEAIEDADASVKRLGDPRELRADLERTRGLVLSMQGSHDAALAALTRSVELYRGGPDPHSSALAWALDDLGAVEGDAGDWEQALTHFFEATRLLRERYGPRNVETERASLNLSLTLRELGKDRDAIELQQQALDVFSTALGPAAFETEWALVLLGHTQLRLGQVASAHENFARAVEVVSHWPKGNHRSVAIAYEGLARSELALGQDADALAHAERAYAAIHESTGDATVLGPAQFTLARALWNDPRQHARALELAHQAGLTLPKAGRDRQDLTDWLAQHEPR